MTRLTLEKRFVDARSAESEMHAYSLWTVGGRVVPDGKRFRIVIDSARPRGVQRYLELSMPAAIWTASELPC